MLLHGRNFLQGKTQSIHHKHHLSDIQSIQFIEFYCAYEEYEESEKAIGRVNEEIAYSVGRLDILQILQH